jgi:hypothetical protein
MVTYGATTTVYAKQPKAISQNLTFDFDEQNFKIAAAITKLDWSNAIDEDFYEISFITRLYANGVDIVTNLNSQKCTTEDILEFYPV